MKKILHLILFFTVLQSQIYAQQYRPMLVDGNEWYQLHIWMNITTIAEDETIIDSISYKNLLNGFYADYLVREDTVTKQVFRWYWDSTEILLYDFSLMPGDTFVYSTPGYTESTVLDSISNNLVHYDLQYITLNIDTPKVFYFSNGAVWIEGIGSLAGIQNSVSSLSSLSSWGVDLICHLDSLGNRNYRYEDPDLFDPWSSYVIVDSCYVLVGTEEVLKTKNDLLIYPNPATETIVVEMKDEAIPIDHVLIYDALGQLKMTEYDLNQTSAALDISRLENGIFFVVVHLEDKTVRRQKIMRNR